MKEFSVAMSITDFIPVILFTITTIILQRDLYNKMSKGAFALLSAGTIDIITAGSCKALYKLLYALGICDFDKLNQMFFPVQSLGFLLAGIAVIAMLCFKQAPKEEKTYAFAPAGLLFLMTVQPVAFSGTMLFVLFMVVGLACIDTGLSIVAGEMGKKWVIALLVVSFFCSLCMGYLSSKDFDRAIFNWIGEAINTIGQGTFLISAIVLHKNGLEDFVLKKHRG